MDGSSDVVLYPSAENGRADSFGRNERFVSQSGAIVQRPAGGRKLAIKTPKGAVDEVLLITWARRAGD
ncbi:MAG TPA: hypothetical protein VH540_17965 [Ktedonobacterales bacterium]|jgi:hypothetical protein